MKPFHLKARWFAVAVLVLLMPVLIEAAGGASTEKNVALVNGSAISDKALESELNQAKQLYLQKGITLSEEQYKEIKKKTLGNLINQELLYQESQKKGIKVDKDIVSGRLAAIKKRFPSQAEFEKTLKEVNLSKTDLLLNIARGIAIEEFINAQIENTIVVTEEENKSFYKANPQFFKQPEQVKASHILIKVDSKADDTKKAQAREKIQGIQQKLKNNEEFAALATEYSEGPSKSKGGDLGFFSRGQMVKPFENAAFAMKPGGISDIVETQFGYHLIQVTDKKAEQIIVYEEVKEKISQHLKQQKTKQEVQSYIQKLREGAKIETDL